MNKPEIDVQNCHNHCRSSSKVGVMFSDKCSLPISYPFPSMEGVEVSGMLPALQRLGNAQVYVLVVNYANKLTKT